jgi:hypothetical protein
MLPRADSMRLTVLMIVSRIAGLNMASTSPDAKMRGTSRAKPPSDDPLQFMSAISAGVNSAGLMDGRRL